MKPTYISPIETEKNIECYIESLDEMIPSRLRGKVTIIGGAVIGRITDFDVYSTNARVQNLDGYVFPNGIELNVVTSMSTDWYENQEGIPLTDFLFNPGNGLTKRFSDETSFRIIKKPGFFITKLACLNDRDEQKDIYDLKHIYTKIFNNKIPEQVSNIVDNFKLNEALESFIKTL